MWVRAGCGHAGVTTTETDDLIVLWLSEAGLVCFWWRQG